MATENIMMEAVKAGGDRQELHEVIRNHSMAAGRRVKEEGLAYLHKNEAVVPEKYNPAISNESTKNALFDALTDFTGIQSVKSASIQSENTKLIRLLEKYLPSIEAGLGQNIVLDDGTLVGKLTPKIDSSLGSLANRKRRGY